MPTHPARALTLLRRLAREPDRRDDGRLLDAFVNRRDEAAFAELLRRHGPLVLGVCRRLLWDSHDADDAFQATFLVLIRKARSIARREQLAGWLYGVAFRTAQKARFRRDRRAAVERQADVTDPPARPAAEPADAAELIDRELLALPEKYRLPLVLCELRGLTRRDAARQLKLAEGTLSSRLARGRVMLRRRLERAGVVLSAAGLLSELATETRAGVPESLFQTTLNGATAGVASAGVQTLVEGVLRSMLLNKIKKTSLAVLVAVGVVSVGVFAVPRSPAAPPVPPAVAPSDRDRLQGTWALAKVGDRDATPEEKQASLGELTFGGDRLIDTFSSGGVREVPFRLDEKPNPKHLDWNVPATRQNPDGFRRAWIYKLDGDTLTLCGKVSETADDERPGEFKSAVKTKQIFIRVLTYKRRGKVLPAVSEALSRAWAAETQHVIEPPDILTISISGEIPEKRSVVGEKLVPPDGTIALGVGGAVSVTGLTPAQAADAIKKHLQGAGPPPRDVGTVRVEVTTFNSKVYYVIVETDNGDQIYRFPYTGSQTITDVLVQTGLPKLPPGGVTVFILREGKKLPVTTTNYQIMPGDRIRVGKGPVASDYGTPAAPTAEPEPYYVNSREFAIPFAVNNAAVKPGETFTVRVSHGNRNTWEMLPPVKAEDKKFAFTAKEDGEYWFGLTRDAAPGSAIIGLKVVVDTKAPVVEIRPWDKGNVRGFEWTVTDDNLDLASLTVSVREDKNADWCPLSVTPTAQGHAVLVGRSPEVRVSVRDKAGNRSEVHFRLGEMGQASGKIVFSPPEPTTLPEPIWTKFGFRVKPAVRTDVAKVDPNLTGGLHVTEVQTGSSAARAGFQPGDILLGIDRYETVTVDHVSFLATHRGLFDLGPIKFFLIREGKIVRGEMSIGE